MFQLNPITVNSQQQQQSASSAPQNSGQPAQMSAGNLTPSRASGGLLSAPQVEPQSAAPVPQAVGHKSQHPPQNQQVGGGDSATGPRTSGSAAEEPLTEHGQATTVIQQQQQQQQALPGHLYCGPQNSRNLYWNFTRAGQSARQSCPDGSIGRASWLCDAERLRFRPAWSADFSQCKSIWLQRLANQLDSLLESASNKQQSNNGELIRQQNEQTLRMVLNDLALMARTKDLFSEDLKRIDIMIGQIIAQLRSLSVSISAPSNSWRTSATQQPANNPFGTLYEELFSKLVSIVSSLFDKSQRFAWLEVQPAELRRRLERRFLNHLKESGAMLAGSLSASQQLGEPAQTWRQANVFANITVINSLVASTNSPRSNSLGFEFETGSEFVTQLNLKHSLDSDEQTNEPKVHLSVLKNLVATGKLLLQ